MILFTGKTIRLYIVLALSLVLFSCEKGSEEDIPSYISLDTISLNPEGQGTSSQKITDAWVFLDDVLIGAFELPFTNVPVLKAGKHQLKIFPGIKMNGIAATRVPYTFYSPVEKEITLIRDSIIDLGTGGSLKVKYSPNTKFAWQEDFEQSAVSIDSTARSLYHLQRTDDPLLVFHQPGEYNSSSGIVLVPSDTGIFECVSHDSFVLPVTGTDVFLEFNYKTNNSVTVGLFVNNPAQTIQEPIITLNPNTAWNKIYINLTSTVIQYQNASDFRVFFGIVKDSNVDEAQFLVDNIKLVHF
jgi:hypothetical protein